MRFAGRIAPGSGTGPIGQASIRFMPFRIAARSVKLSFCDRFRPKSMRIVESVDLILPFVAEARAARDEAVSEVWATFPLAESDLVVSGRCALDPPHAATAKASIARSAGL